MNARLAKWAMPAGTIALALATGVAIGRFSASTSAGETPRESETTSIGATSRAAGATASESSPTGATKR